MTIRESGQERLVSLLTALKAGREPWNAAVALDVCGYNLIQERQVVRVVGLSIAANEGFVVLCCHSKCLFLCRKSGFLTHLCEFRLTLCGPWLLVKWPEGWLRGITR